jgi:hypothetical protein
MQALCQSWQNAGIGGVDRSMGTSAPQFDVRVVAATRQAEPLRDGTQDRYFASGGAFGPRELD